MSQRSVAGNMPKESFSFRLFQKHQNAIVHIISGLLILLFTYAAFSKLADVKTFYGQMNNQPMPNWMTPYLVWGVPGIELLIVFGLMFDKTRMTGLWASFILMLTFTSYVALILFNAFDRIPCSCGGILRQMTWKQHLVFNLFFTVLPALAICMLRKRIYNQPGK